MAAATNRLQLLPAPSIIKPSIFFSKPSLAFNLRLSSFRRISTTPCLCSSSDQSPQVVSSEAESSKSIVGDLLDYLNESWTHFHATAEAKRQLTDAGFNLLSENDEWDLKPGGRYFFTRNMSCLVAFAVGEKYEVGNGFHAIAAHTDSPCLKLKPKSASAKSNYLMVNVQTYGGGLWHTWFDRDLSVAGRVIVRDSDGSYLHKLVKVKRPLLRVPTLAIHLDRTVNKDGFKPNLETHLVPLLSLKPEESTSSEKNGATSKAVHHPLLMQVLSEELGYDADDIVSIELNLCDTQPSCLGGGNNEFIFSGRLDNLASSYCALRALIDSCGSPGDLSTDHAIRMVALFDNEEVGSDSYQGAGAPTMFQAMRRITDSLANNYVGESAFERAIRKSFLVSADMAHGVHPNFMDKHEEHHRPEMQKGLVIKHNANQRYATSGVTAFLFKEVGKLHNLPTQEFVVRNDFGCGSTIGPILASGVGIRTVDCGIAQLSMHSVREVCGKEDIDIAYKHFKAFYQSFSSIDQKLSVDFYKEVDDEQRYWDEIIAGLEPHKRVMVNNSEHMWEAKERLKKKLMNRKPLEMEGDGYHIHILMDMVKTSEDLVEYQMRGLTKENDEKKNKEGQQKNKIKDENDVKKIVTAAMGSKRGADAGPAEEMQTSSKKEEGHP